MSEGGAEHREDPSKGYLLRDQYGETVNISRSLGGTNPVVIGVALTKKLDIGKTIALDRQGNGKLEYYEVEVPQKKFRRVQEKHKNSVWVKPLNKEDNEIHERLEKIGWNPDYTLDTLPLTQVVKDKLKIPRK